MYNKDIKIRNMEKTKMENNVKSWEMEKAIVGETIEMPYSKRQGAWVAEFTNWIASVLMLKKMMEQSKLGKSKKIKFTAYALAQKRKNNIL